MKRALLFLALAGCAFAQKHPAITTGLVAGSLGFTVCEIDADEPKACAVVGAGAAAFLGGIAALVTLFADTSDHSLPPDDEDEPGVVRVHTRTEPPPMAADAGVAADAWVAADAGVAADAAR